MLPALYDRSARRRSTDCLSPSSSSAEPHLCARELLQGHSADRAPLGHQDSLSDPYASVPLLTRNTCPSGCLTCISRTCHGMSSGGKVTSSPAARHCLWTSSTSSTHTDIHTPLSAVSSPSGPNVERFAPLPRLPWPPWQRNISHSPDPTDPKVGGVPQSQHFFQPHFSNHAKLAGTSDTFKIGVMCFASIARKHTTATDLLFRCSTAKTHHAPLLTRHSSVATSLKIVSRAPRGTCFSLSLGSCGCPR